jgi:hypothetical protein
MEELITTVIVLIANFGLNLRDSVTHQTQMPTYYEVEKSDNLAEINPLPHHHLHHIGKSHLAGNKASRRKSLTDSPRLAL